MTRLKQFITRTFGEEGSFQNHPKDKGNYYKGKLYGTIWGITARDNFQTFTYCHTLYKNKQIEQSKNYAELFYSQSQYWNKLYDKIVDENIAFKIWDTGINIGVKTTVKILQRILQKYESSLAIDGVFGESTLQVLNLFNVYDEYILELEKYYRGLKGFKFFGIGWLKRLFRRFK